MSRAAAVGAFTNAAAPEPATAAAPAATTPTFIRPRRETTESTMSPKYSLSEVLGTSWKHASPHLKRHVMELRLPCTGAGVSRLSSLRRESAIGNPDLSSGGHCRHANQPPAPVVDTGLNLA